MLYQSKQAVLDHPQDADALGRYLRQAIAHNQIEDAKITIAQLQLQFPWNHQLRRASIALCLHQKDYSAAMESIETLVAFSTPEDALIDSALAVRRHLGPKVIPDQLPAEPALSICLIVRNEQAFLGACLNAVKTLADEIIVIDTGSTDRSADIARIYGALVYDFEWCEDFSAARNASLDKAHGAWVLILDADEIIAPQDRPELKRMVAQGTGLSRGYSFQTRNYSNLANAVGWQANDRSYPQQEAGMGWFPTNKVRMFPRIGDIRFTYPVHELVDPSIRAAGMAIEDCPIPIHHYGHLNEARNAQKARRYFELGYNKLEQLGHDKVALRELAIQAGQLRLWSESIELWQRFLEISPEDGHAFANMAGAYWQLGNYEQGMAFARRAVRVYPDLKEGHYNLALNLLMAGRFEKAVRILKDLLSRHPHYLAAEFMLAAALSIDDEHHSGQSLFDSLEKKISSQALAVAVEDLFRKLISSGPAGSAEKLARAAGRNRFIENHAKEIC